MALAAIVLLIHWEHARALSAARAAGLDHIPLPTLHKIFPTAASLGNPTAHGGREVLNAEGTLLGEVLQTFPEAERFLGFSGPTNVAIGIDKDGNCAGLAILSSRDTKDHVHLIQHNDRFQNALKGTPLTVAAHTRVDAVSGATLTSLTILQGVRARLGMTTSSLKFPDPVALSDAQQLFPQAAALAPDKDAADLWQVHNANGLQIGWILSTSPAADEIVGYQGPTRALLGAQLNGEIIGIVIAGTYDNEPYVGYVRQDDWFRAIFNGKTLQQLGTTSWEEAGIEGVSGATMTSQAVAQGLLLAAAQVQQRREQMAVANQNAMATRWRGVTTAAIMALGLVMGFTRLRGKNWFRRPYQLLLIAYLGLINGDLLSLAMFVGWSQSGIPWSNAIGLVCLSAAAIVLPIAARQNVYCDHLCPHGAAQQLLPRRWKLRRHPRWLIRMLSCLRPALLLVVVLVGIGRLHVNLVSIEPFDAYAWRAAGAATITIAVLGLVGSLFIPMGYCRYGCPTGAVLSYLRRSSHGASLVPADGVALMLLIVALGLRSS